MKNPDKYLKKIKKATLYIKRKTRSNIFDIAIIFGSGLSPTDKIINNCIIPYYKIPYFPNPTVEGHDGKLIHAYINDKSVLCFLGRLHYYEGYSLEEVTFPIRIMKELGVKILIITNACGGINKKFKSGDFMIIKDQINLTGLNPLIGPNIKEHGVRFVDMSDPYSARLINILNKSIKQKLKEGVYIGVTGPSYESKAEIKFYRSIGADAVGMSTVLETIVSSHCNIETLGISCIVNSIMDKTKDKINHEKVIQVAKKMENDLLSILVNFIGLI